MAMSKCKECGKAVSTLAKTCPNCGVPKPTKELKKSNIKKSKVRNIKKKGTWAHCSNKKCKDYTQMYKLNIPDITRRTCPVCFKSYKKAKIVNGRPEMPTDGKYKMPNPLSGTYLKQSQREAYDNAIKNRDSTVSSSTQNTSNNNIDPGEKDAFTKLMDGELDLATAFWGFGVVGTMIVGFICGWLSEAYSKWWLIPYIIFVVLVIDGLWAAARNYKIEQVKKKQSEVWGFLVQAFCVMGGLGLFTLIKDTFF